MNRLKQKLSVEEKELLDAFESGNLRSAPHLVAEKRRFQTMAKAHGLKNKRVSLRMSEWDFTMIQEEALREGWHIKVYYPVLFIT